MGLFFCLGAGRRIPASVTVQGVNVGGMSYSMAEKCVLEEIERTLLPLTVETPRGEYTFAYPALSYTCDVKSVLRKAKRGEALTLHVERTWANMEEELGTICEQNAQEGKDAQLSFSAKGFTYVAEQKGTYCDYARLLQDAVLALKEGRDRVTLHTGTYLPEITQKELVGRTRLISSVSTRFDASNLPRTHNIRLAAQRISGTVLNPGESFSFNKTVGKRTKENGFEEAAVIFEGQFVQGVGGGVCQASTTLFGAALRAGLKITQSRAHSLSVSYVPPSLDAMVSEESDLAFYNPHSFPVYILSRVNGGIVTFEVYGKPNGLTYRTESVVKARVAPPPALVEEGEEDRTVRGEKEGIKSESYLLTYRGETLLSRTLIRRDSYAPVQGVYEKKKEPLEGEAGEVPPAPENLQNP